MDWGDHVKTLEAQEELFGVKPKALQDRPTIPPEHRKYLDAFNSLSRARQNGFNANGISIREIESYCNLMGIPEGFHRRVMFELIDSMDAAFVQRINKKDK